MGTKKKTTKTVAERKKTTKKAAVAGDPLREPVRRGARKKVGKGARSSARSKARGKVTRSPATASLKELQQKYSKDVHGSGIAESNRLADMDVAETPRMFVSTGSLSLDRSLTPPWSKDGGIPLGRVTEIVGPAHIGKTTTLDHIFANCQRVGGVSVLIETDTKRDSYYTKKIGVNLEELNVIEFKDWADQNMENVWDQVASAVEFWRREAPDVPVIVGVDALGVTPTQDEVKKTLAQGTTASAARINRKACRKISGLVSNSNVGIVLLNHEYTSISFGGPVKPKKVYGGEAIELLATVRLKLHPVQNGWLKDRKGVILGRVVGFDLRKFKLGPAHTEGRYAILSSVGIDNVWTVYDRLSACNYIQTAGSWSALNLGGDEVLKFQGFLGLRDKCLENPELFGRLVAAYRGTYDANV